MNKNPITTGGSFFSEPVIGSPLRYVWSPDALRDVPSINNLSFKLEDYYLKLIIQNEGENVGKFPPNWTIVDIARIANRVLNDEKAVSDIAEIMETSTEETWDGVARQVLAYLGR